MQSVAVAQVASCHPASINSIKQRSFGSVLPARLSRRSLRASKMIAPRAGAPPPPPPPPVWEPTGVPLVDELASFATLKDSGLAGFKLIALAAVGVFVGSKILTILGSKLGSVNDEGKRGFKPISALLAAASAPASALLPYYGAIYSATVAGALIQVVSTKAKAQFNQVCLGHAKEVLSAVKISTQLVQDLSEIIVIVGGAWTLINLKDRLIAYALNSFLGGVDSQSGLARMTRTVGGLLNYGVYVGAVFASIAAFGINITPLIASVGGASVVIGLAAQSIIGNIASAVTLYASPPFAAGDAVKFLADGALVVEGTVLAIEPMRTILKTADGSTLYISNSSVVNWMVQNDSQKR